MAVVNTATIITGTTSITMCNAFHRLQPLAFLRLQNWLSPLFPTGSYSYSHGLEWAVEAGHVDDRASLVDWLAADLRYGSGRSEAIFFSAAWSSAKDDNRGGLLEVAELAAAFRGSAEFALESAQQGSACRATFSQVWRDPFTAIREDASMNLAAIEDMNRKFPHAELCFIESGGDNLAATFSPELADLTIYVIDVAEGEKIPRKGGPGITRSDLLVINKIDLAPLVGADLEVMRADTLKMRLNRPFVFTNLKSGEGVEQIARFIGENGGLAKAAA